MRREHDFYPTPTWATKELLKRAPFIGGSVLEPCVGYGAIADPLREHRYVEALRTNDLDRQWAADSHEDATDPRWWATMRPDWVITNPPFCDAHLIVPLAFKHAVSGVAMLLRITYLEPCEGRSAWLAEYPPDGLIVLPRISFTGDGHTDSATCAWMIWGYMEGSSIQVAPLIDDRQVPLFAEEAHS